MSNLADLKAPEPIRMTLAGCDLDVNPMMMCDAAILQAIVNRMPPPRDHKKTIAILDQMKADGEIDPGDYDFQKREAIQERIQWPPDMIVDDRGIQALTRNAEGQIEILKLALAINAEEATRLARSLTAMEFMRLASAFLNGVDPAAPAKESPDGPKGGTSIPTPSGDSGDTPAAPTTTAS